LDLNSLENLASTSDLFKNDTADFLIKPKIKQEKKYLDVL